MLEDATSVLASSGELARTHGGGKLGGVGSNSGEDDRIRSDEGDRRFVGNRWPRQETLALLKIRSEMDVVFRDASVKGPMWEEVSRKLSQLGYHRSAKKCKEKFENVYKYNKRTKEGRGGKPDGKTYRFFEQLEALESHNSQLPMLQQPRPNQTPVAVTPVASTPPVVVSQQHFTVPSSTRIASQPISLTIPSLTVTDTDIFSQQTNNPQNFVSSTYLMSNSTSSSTSSDEEFERRHKRNKKWKDFFERLMREVIEKQEVLQKKFLESLEKRENERMAREEARRMQEMSRINQEREVLAQERSMGAAKDAAVLTFLQRISEQQNPGQIQIDLPPPPPPPTPLQPISALASLQPQPAPPRIQLTVPAPLLMSLPQQQPTVIVNIPKTDNSEENFSTPPSSSRWPKVEVEALIKVRTNLDSKYQENGPKGPLWEEISSEMRKLGYNRNSKRCKEKWENINKYFKKVKESNRKRPEDSKTCPYFHQLDALYREKNRNDSSSLNLFKVDETMPPLIVRPEQQWPPATDTVMQDVESEQNREEEDEEEDEDGGEFKIVASRQMNEEQG